MPESKEATTSHPVLSRPPRLSGGKITPVVLRAFEIQIENYFLNAKEAIAETDKVTRLLGCFEGPLVNQWISQNRTRLRGLTFSAFITEFRKRWLPKTWEQDFLRQIMRARLDPRRSSFEDWSTEVQIINDALTGTTSFLTEDQMRRQLESNIDEDLRWLLRKGKVNAVTDFAEWLEAVSEIDHDRQIDLQIERKQVADFIQEKTRAGTLVV